MRPGPTHAEPPGKARATDPSKSHKTNKIHDGEMKSSLTDATSKPFGANCTLTLGHQTML